MAEAKTKKNRTDVKAFLSSIEHARKREEAFQILDMMTELTGEEACMWGASIVGFGTYHYVYESGREGDFMMAGFSPRKQNLTIYIIPGFKKYDAILARLGKFKTGSSCLYINKLADVDMDVLRELVMKSYTDMVKKYNK